MIGKLRGIVESTDTESLILDVNGVGYHVFAASRILAALETGTAVSLMIESHVREDHIHLYGFSDTAERDWFRLLATVQGVGNKTALAILGAYAPAQLMQAILAKDIAAFKAISGIGPKLAERIVTELKDKALKVGAGTLAMPAAAPAGKTAAVKKASAAEDAISALVNLGYSRSDAHAAVMRAAETLGAEAGLDALIRAGLQEVARK